MKILPKRTVERLSEYRRTLLRCLDEGKTHIYSHELADLHNITAVQVRRDIMFAGYTSPQRKGYEIEQLIKTISRIIDPKETMNVAVIGFGNLGRAITAYFTGKRKILNLVASFDIDPKKVNTEIAGVKCYPIDRLREVVLDKNITIGILTVPAGASQEMAKAIVDAGIRGILNFTSVSINVPPQIYLEDYDMVTSMEKVAYFMKHRKK